MAETTSIKHKLAEVLSKAATEAQSSGRLAAVPLPEINIERPQKPEHGDYASSLPLKLARALGTNPLSIANEIVKFIGATSELSSVQAASPGFINFTLKSDWLAKQVEGILASGKSFGNGVLGKGSKVQIEFVSVNPTGPLHVGHGRGAILGSTLANVLAAAGYTVETEYYINDAGSQMDNFAHSLYARYLQAQGREEEIPAQGYVGAYVIDLAKEVLDEYGDRFLNLPEADALVGLQKIGLDKMIAAIRSELERLKVTFNVWFSEKSLYDNNQYNLVMNLLKERNYISEREGAIWLVSTALGDDKDNVLVRSDGSPTYFASDIAYHYNKFIERKFDRVINIWGADHQGHVPRMKAAVSALGVDSSRLEIIISQMVTLRRGEELVRISKRSGDIITLEEVVDEVGADACRFFFLARSADSQMDFDLELAKQQSQENPVYYVQYAHARIASILRLAEEKGIDYSDGDCSLLTTEPELTLIRKMLMLPEIVETIAVTLQPHHLTYYSQELATVFHSFYKQCRVISIEADELAISKARLKLVEAAKKVLARTLNLMGMAAPDKM
ncbi:arginine--tRNA ligase [Chloroflexota bacterium]